MFYKTRLATALIAATIGAGNTIAQEGEEKAKQSSSGMLEEVIVTAQKREQSLQDVPSSVQVLSGDELENTGVQTSFDLVKYLPGFGLDDNTEIRTTTLKTRGVGTFTNSIGLQSSNLIVVDGEVLPRQSMMNLAVADVERVEAMRGPQGTLFGQNTSTGLIHYVTKRPVIGEFEGKIRAELTEFSGQDIRGALNVPIADQWALRVNAQYNTVDGWIENTMPGEEDYDIGDEEAHSLRAQLLYDNNANFQALFRADYSEKDTNCCSFSRIGPVDENFGPNPIILVNPDDTITGTTYNSIDSELSFDDTGKPVTARNREGNFGSTENKGISAELNYDFENNMALTYIGSYRDFELLNSSTFFTVNFPVERLAFGGNESVEVIQQELRLSSFGNDKLDWVVGLFYHDTDGQRSEVRDGCIAGNRGLIENDLLSGCFSGPSTDAFLANVDATGVDDRSLLVPQRLLNGGDFTTSFENIAVFGQLEYHITDKLDATLGFRALREEGAATFSRTDLNTPATGVGMETFDEVLALAQNDPSLFIESTAPTEFSDSDTALIYKTVLGYDFTDGIRGYVSYSTGYKGSSYFVTSNTDPAEAENFPTKPEQSTNFEIGLRSQLFEDRLMFNLTYFDMSVEDFQVRAIRVIDDVNNIVFAGYVNADEVRSTGFEADVIFQLTEGLQLSANYANFKATYEDFSDTPTSCPGGDGGALASRCSTVAGQQVLDQTGLDLENNAEEQFLGTVQYDQDIGDTGWDGNVRAVWRYESGHTKSINELAFGGSSNPSTSIWDLYFGVGNDRLRANLFIKNVFDKEYTTRQNLDNLGFGTAFFPRDYTRFFGGSIEYSFF